MANDYHTVSLRVFISYHPNDRAAAELVRQHVLSWGHQVWMDVYDLGDAPPDSVAAQGSRLRALDQCDVVVVLITPDATRDDSFVRREIVYALAVGTRIIPLKYPGGVMPMTINLLTFISFEDYDTGLAELFKRLARSETPPEMDEEAELAVEDDTGGAVPPPAPAAAPAPAPAPRDYAEPKPKAARRERATREVERARPEPSDAAEPPQFTAFYPQAIQPAQAYALMVFAHLDSARGAVQEIAAGYAPMMGGAQASDSTPSKLAIDPGSLITVVPQIAGITFEPAEQVMTWQPPHVSASFLFTTPQTLTADLAGRVLIYHGPLIAGEIPVTLVAIKQPQTRTSGPAPLNQEAAMRAYDPVFASYSHRDTPVMEYFRRARANMGQRMLVDIYDLRAGEHWADRLLEMIEQSAVFQLFWSQHSARSPYCRQEWQHALNYSHQRPRFVQPVYWSGTGPAPDPPPELADLHFQRVTLPPLTRVQLAVAKVRSALRGG